MSGIKLKSEKLSDIKVERIKWILLLFISHVFTFLLQSPAKIEKEKEFPEPKQGFVRLQLQVVSQAPQSVFGKPILLMTQEKNLISKDAVLLKKIISTNSLDSIQNQYLVDLPEKDLNNLINVKSKQLIAYPAFKTVNLKSKTKRKNYEIHF